MKKKTGGRNKDKGLSQAVIEREVK